MIISIFTAGCQKESANSTYEIMTVPGIGALANSYIIASDGEAALIDPGQVEEMIELLEEYALTPKLVLLTHGHFDHIAGIEELIRVHPDTTVMVHEADARKLTDPGANVSELFGTAVSVQIPVAQLKGNQTIKIGKATIKVVETPGHTSGSVCFRLDKDIFTGDTLMKGAVGRTDFPDGNPQALTRSLEKLMTMPEELNILPGHGDPTTIGEEKKSNPYL